MYSSLNENSSSEENWGMTLMEYSSRVLEILPLAMASSSLMIDGMRSTAALGFQPTATFILFVSTISRYAISTSVALAFTSNAKTSSMRSIVSVFARSLLRCWTDAGDFCANSL